MFLEDGIPSVKNAESALVVPLPDPVEEVEITAEESPDLFGLTIEAFEDFDAGRAEKWP